MPKKYCFTEEQIATLKEARRATKNQKSKNRLKAIIQRAEGKGHGQIAKSCGYHPAYVSRLVSTFCNQGVSVLVDNHYAGNRRNMSKEEEEAFMAEYKKRMSEGDPIAVDEIKKAYEEKVGHSIGGGQIYRVLHRHGWSKPMARRSQPIRTRQEKEIAEK